MIIYKKLFLLLVSCLVACNLSAREYSMGFPDNFIGTYDLTKRDTHEYNSYTLAKTRKSFLELENSLKDAGLNLAGRYCIFGYQEEAIPPYKTDWEREAIADEAIVKTHAGLSQPTKNIFGFMTGFLLKDTEWMHNQWFNSDPKICHILGRPIEIFSDKAITFQKHGFGKDYDFIISARDNVERAVYSQDLKKVLNELIEFWCQMEKRASKTGSAENVATQDMLFSIDYARALIEGQTKIQRFFIGPDITYPIEVLRCQKTQATVHAQKFIQKLQHDLIAVDDENTVFIFCSFVDGVGKSTLLNNIRNWGIYGDQFDKYERCDNSSSQESTLFKLKDKVYIADLPAQISHFVIKPDGFVFSDIKTIKEISKDKFTQIVAHIKTNKQQLIDDFEKAKGQMAKIIDDPLYNNPDPIMQYAHNCVIMQNVQEKWVPCKFEEHYLLFDKEQLDNIRALVPLASAHSMGLKVIEPEQMLFSKGLSLPMRYAVFVDDLVEKLKGAGIKNVIFMDFLSMYPRSSRENIRLNFVLQYIKKIYGTNYDMNRSFYAHWVHKAQEICHMLNNHLDETSQMLVLETVLRWALDIILDETPADQLSYIYGDQLETKLKEIVSDILEKLSTTLYKQTYDRLEPEQAIYYDSYKFDKIYESIVRFSSEPLVAYSQVLIHLFTNLTADGYFNALWANLDTQLKLPLSAFKSLPMKINVTPEVTLSVTLVIHKSCREETTLRDFIRIIRAQWFATLSNLLQASVDVDGQYEFAKVEQAVPPLALQLGPDGALYGVTKSLPLIDTKTTKLMAPSKFHIMDSAMKKRTWGYFDKYPHCIEWDNKGTHYGIYCYSYNHLPQTKNVVSKIVDRYRQICIQRGKSNFAMPVSELYNQLLVKAASDALDAEAKGKKIETIAVGDPRIAGLQLFVRAVATMDMIIKDIESRVIVRKGSKEDFVAAMRLMERITLPYYFGIKCSEPLFEDYGSVQPIIPWEIINKY